jgi:hypothetical protein
MKKLPNFFFEIVDTILIELFKAMPFPLPCSKGKQLEGLRNETFRMILSSNANLESRNHTGYVRRPSGRFECEESSKNNSFH